MKRTLWKEGFSSYFSWFSFFDTLQKVEDLRIFKTSAYGALYGRKFCSPGLEIFKHKYRDTKLKKKFLVYFLLIFCWSFIELEYKLGLTDHCLYRCWQCKRASLRRLYSAYVKLKNFGYTRLNFRLNLISSHRWKLIYKKFAHFRYRSGILIKSTFKLVGLQDSP